MLNFEFFGFFSTSTVRLHKHQHHRAKTKFRHISRISTGMVWSPGCDDLWLVIDWRPRWKSRNSLCPSAPSVKRRRDSACDATLAKEKETSHTKNVWHCTLRFPCGAYWQYKWIFDRIWQVYWHYWPMDLYGCWALWQFIEFDVKLSNFQRFPVVSSS